MNVHFQKFFLFAVVCLLLLFGVCAAGPDELALDTPETPAVSSPVEPSPSLVVSGDSLGELVSSLVSALGNLTVQGELDSVRAVSVPLEEVESGISPAYDLDNGSTSEPSGTLKSILVKLIGPYNPVVVEYRYQNYNQSSYSYVREIQPDYVWFFSVGIFALLLFCTFRLGGVLLRKI